MSTEYGKPLSAVVGEGFEVPPLPDGWTPLDGILLIKCLDEEGHSSWAFRETQGLNEEETIGALTVQLDILRERVVDKFRDQDDD